MIRTFESEVYALRNGVRLKRLKCVEPPNIYADASSMIKTSLSGRFLEDGEVNWLSDEIQPVIVIDGEEFPAGVFRAANITMNLDGRGRILEVEAYDRGYMVQQCRTERIIHLASGTNYIDAIESLLAVCGVTRILKTPTAYTLTTDREDWEVGSSYLTIVNQLLAEINYRELWFDANGYAVMKPVQTLSADRVNHTYDTESLFSVTARDCESETDLYNKPNVFVVIFANPDLEEIMVATAENNSPSSPTSTVSRGMRITSVTKVDNIASQEALQAYAEELRGKSMLSSETVTIKTAIMPNHGIGDTVALNHPGAQGIYEETGWYMELKAGEYMSHDLRKVVYL